MNLVQNGKDHEAAGDDQVKPGVRNDGDAVQAEKPDQRPVHKDAEEPEENGEGDAHLDGDPGVGDGFLPLPRPQFLGDQDLSAGAGDET